MTQTHFDHEMDMVSSDLWTGQRNPGRLDGQRDQDVDDKRLLPAFKAALLSESQSRCTDYLASAPPELLRTLTSPSNSRPSFPSSYFESVLQPPSNEEVDRLSRLYLTTVHTQLHFLNEIPIDFVSLNEQCLSLAVAALGSISIGDTVNGARLCRLSARSMFAGLALDNRRARNNHVIFSGLIQQTVAAMIHNTDTWRHTNITRGFPNGMMKRLYSSDNRQAITHGRLLITYALLIDTVRSLHFGVPATIARSLADVPCLPQNGSFSQLLSTTIFGPPTAQWLPYSEQNSLLLLLLIFSEEQVWRTMMFSDSHEVCFSGDSASANSSAHLKSIRRTLSRWKVEYMNQVTPELKAFYHFCEMYLLFKDLESLPDVAGYRIKEKKKPDFRSALTHTTATTLDDDKDRNQASHHAWLLLEHVSASSTPAAIWLPVILYMAGLVVWYDICSRQGSRSHGSMMVLNLFVKELRRMHWPCCLEMVKNLEQLASQTGNL